MATLDAVSMNLRKRMTEAYRSRGLPNPDLETAVDTFVEAVVEHPRTAQLVAVESFSLGAPAVAYRGQVLACLEEAADEALSRAGVERQRREVMARAVAGGMRHAAYACLRSGRPDALLAHRDELLEWARSYAEAVEPESPASRSLTSPPTAATGDRTREPSAETSRRDRIGEAAVAIVAERGYAGLAIPLISARAGVSHQTFYESFSDKRGAFLAGFDALVDEINAATSNAFASCSLWEEGVAAATATLLGRLSEDEALASVALLELPTLGAEALDSRGLIRNCLGVLLGPEVRGGSGADSPSSLILEAIYGGIGTVIQHELTSGALRSLPSLAPELARFVLIPFRYWEDAGGPERLAVAGGEPLTRNDRP